jgi:phenylacetate-CoA ligase
MNRQQSLYNRSPYPLRVLAATIHGYRLSNIRYGLETQLLVEDALKRDYWSKEQWNTWKGDRLEYILHRAVTRVPFYREYWEKRKGDKRSWERLEDWPVITKETLRANPRSFVADDCDFRQMFHEHTSGTTGKSLSLWWSRKTMRAWYALVEARVRYWNRVSRQDRWAIFGGQLVVPFGQSKPPFWVWNAGLKQLYMSSYHLAPDFIQSYIDALYQYRVTYLYGYASSLHSLAQIALEKGITLPAVKVVISNAETLYQHQRNTITKAFQCPVRDTYGMSEIVCASSECNEGRQHLWPEVGHIEVLNDDSEQPVSPGEAGRFICTGLLNADMPLVRYEVGDRGYFTTPETDCACGRKMPLLGEIEGRQDDMILTPDGRRIGRLDPVFKADLPIREAQIIQESLTNIRIRYIPAPGFTENDQASIIERMHQRVGAMSIILEKVDTIPRSANGKFRAVISKVSLPQQFSYTQPEKDNVNARL